MPPWPEFTGGGSSLFGSANDACRGKSRGRSRRRVARCKWIGRISETALGQGEFRRILSAFQRTKALQRGEHARRRDKQRRPFPVLRKLKRRLLARRASRTGGNGIQGTRGNTPRRRGEIRKNCPFDRSADSAGASRKARPQGRRLSLIHI